ncbi:aminotransferase class I/II-fold pyridoxal phosphate-dependent enzyme [Sunxiuqinia elliptica]|uniref:Glycine C-acetyltransferase/8-amino-7-oxononanoate synthase n=1 Tax=Sunxiuqinia elliptica TaxID=655355 RepID=A0A4R6H708_9BACT|nr:aminotransferase class I/II-fold pyridoxal phosphate-dependent enzyme [Sunxiuqinia elliptica]TDO04000.1 glycine C-acetyltransferase/8-amino-7-oxononanoate synthase [Sunxiuqinia elliptica]TDO62282.1 glycine C-acetyltransferase/8-amino-7-oxononanoate synthase [Sunxiuqinia elliptica]
MIILEGSVGSFITIERTSYHYFAGNNYLGMANRPEVIAAACEALKKYGTNVAASRRTTGTTDIHLQLEKQLAQFKGQDDAIVFSSGYLGNKLLMDQLKNEITVVITDSMTHSSILEGIPPTIQEIANYKHGNMKQLESLLNDFKQQNILIATDGIFALTGDIAPLDEIYALAQKHQALVLVDDAHATGILGKHGRGTPEHFGLHNAPGLFQSETMSKAFGSYGGFVAGSHQLITPIREKSAFYGASTALPPVLAAAGIASLQFLEKHPDLHSKLLAKASQLKTAIATLGYITNEITTPIVPLFFEHATEAQQLSNFLKANQIIAPVVNYPVKADQAILRLALSIDHSEEQLDYLLSTLKKWKEHHGRN